jgi:hypothetical protein
MGEAKRRKAAGMTGRPSRPGPGDWVQVPRGEFGDFTVQVGEETAGLPAPRWHLSISHRTNEHPPKPGRYPTWDEIKDARYRFMPGDIYVAQILPPADDYVSVMDTCFHLWQIPEEAGQA